MRTREGRRGGTRRVESPNRAGNEPSRSFRNHGKAPYLGLAAIKIMLTLSTRDLVGAFSVIVKSSRTFVSSSNVDFISELHRRRYEDEEKGWDWTNLLLDEECRMWLKMQYWDSSGLWGPSQHPEKIFSCRNVLRILIMGRRWPGQGWTAALRLFITPLISLLITSAGTEEKTESGMKKFKEMIFKDPTLPVFREKLLDSDLYLYLLLFT